MQVTTAKLTAQVREAGYEVVRCEQLRTNRWLVTARDSEGQTILIMAQQRALVSSADVQDLVEQLQCRRCEKGMLLAIDGNFSNEAWHTATELRRWSLQLCLSLAPSGSAVAGRVRLETA